MYTGHDLAISRTRDVIVPLTVQFPIGLYDFLIPIGAPLEPTHITNFILAHKN